MTSAVMGSRPRTKTERCASSVSGTPGPQPIGYVPAGPVRARLDALLWSGWSLDDVADHSGVDTATLRVLTGPVAVDARVRVRLAEAVAAVGRAPMDVWEVPATGTVRRLQALAALGWDPTVLAACAGLAWAVVRRVQVVAAGSALLVARAYDRLSMTPAPAGPGAARVAASAARHRWAPPLAWDDEDLDDPAATVPPPRPPRRGLAAAEVLELRAIGLSDLEISARLRLQVHTVTRRARRAAA